MLYVWALALQYKTFLCNFGSVFQFACPPLQPCMYACSYTCTKHLISLIIIKFLCIHKQVSKLSFVPVLCLDKLPKLLGRTTACAAACTAVQLYAMAIVALS